MVAGKITSQVGNAGENEMSDQQKRVLVVDDEDDLTWSISKHLTKDKDKYELICVNSGKKALEVLSQLPINLVISDIRMPEISGLELLVKIRDYYPSTKVIIMTAYGSSEVQDEANQRGCFKYIEKPFEINELRKLITEAIEEKKGFKGTVSDFHLSDLIQMNCLGRMTMSLTISREDKKGIIFFDEGNIVHAQCENLEGDEALYELLTWDGGNFSTDRGKQAPKETVIKGWQSLLLEGLRRLDETLPKQKGEFEGKHEWRTAKINDILSELLKVNGVLLVSVFDPEGFPIASKLSKTSLKKYTMGEISPVFSNLIKQVDISGNDLKLDITNDIVVEFGQAILKITRIYNKKEYLILLAETGKNLGVLRLEAKKYLRLLSEIL